MKCGGTFQGGQFILLETHKGQHILTFFRSNELLYQAVGHTLLTDKYARCRLKVTRDYAFLNIYVSREDVRVAIVVPKQSSLEEIASIG